MTEPCRQPPSPTLLAALRQFNDGAYFVCHETLEELWKAETRPLRDVYKGVLQIGIGLLHRERGNLAGARLLLTRGQELLTPFLPACCGLDLADLCAQATRVLERLDAPGGEAPQAGDEGRPRLRLWGE